jgi:hypothetical protein
MGQTTRSRDIGRNDPCHCGSGKKYKHCHGKTAGTMSPARRALLFTVIGVFVGLLIFVVASRSRDAAPAGRVWSAEHGHWHDQ